MDNQDGLGETQCDLSQARIAPYKNTWKRFQSSLNKEDCSFIKQDQTQLFSETHCLQSSLRKRYATRLRIRRRQLKSKGGGRTTTHFPACDENIQLILKMIISVNQLSLCGAVAHLIKELAEDQNASGRLVAEDPTEQEILSQLPIAAVQANDEWWWDRLVARIWAKYRKHKNYQKTRSYPNCAPKQVWTWSALPSPKEPKNQSLCREYTLLRDDERTCANGWIQSNAKFGPASDIKVCKSIGRHGIEVEVPSLFEDQTISWIRIANGVGARERAPGHVRSTRETQPGRSYWPWELTCQEKRNRRRMGARWWTRKRIRDATARCGALASGWWLIPPDQWCRKTSRREDRDEQQEPEREHQRRSQTQHKEGQRSVKSQYEENVERARKHRGRMAYGWFFFKEYHDEWATERKRAAQRRNAKGVRRNQTRHGTRIQYEEEKWQKEQLRQRDEAEQRDGEGSERRVEQQNCDKMHVFEGRVFDREYSRQCTTPKKRVVWWRNAWWIWVEDGPDFRTARERRCPSSHNCSGRDSSQWRELCSWRSSSFKST